MVRVSPHHIAIDTIAWIDVHGTSGILQNRGRLRVHCLGSKLRFLRLLQGLTEHRRGVEAWGTQLTGDPSCGQCVAVSFPGALAREASGGIQDGRR